MSKPITMISSMATRQVLAELADAYERASGQAVAIESVGGVDAARRVREGEAFDLVTLASNVIDELAAEGHLLAGSRVDIARSGVAVAIRAGAARPDIAGEDALRQAVVAARTIGYSTGPSGTHLQKLFERWGIAQAIAARTVQARPGVPVGTLVASGEVELGFQQLSELIDLPGVEILGPLPPGTQVLTVFCGGVTRVSARADAARAVLAFMASAAGDAVKRRRGMEPA